MISILTFALIFIFVFVIIFLILFLFLSLSIFIFVVDFVFILIIPIIISLFLTGQFLNNKLKNHYLEKETAETKATFIGFREQSYLGRYGTTMSEKFAIIKYKTNFGIITQGLKEEEFEKNKKHFKSELNIGEKNSNGGKLNTRKATIIYSLKFPSFFKIKE